MWEAARLLQFPGRGRARRTPATDEENNMEDNDKAKAADVTKNANDWAKRLRELADWIEREQPGGWPVTRALGQLIGDLAHATIKAAEEAGIDLDREAAEWRDSVEKGDARE